MKILFFGDSITDMNRNRNVEDGCIWSYGNGYPFFVAGELLKNAPDRYEIVNRGISGNRIVDLYARAKMDVWNEKPDVLSILVGVNDVWHELANGNGVELDRFEKIYSMLIEDTLARVPEVKIILCEPFVLHGTATDGNFEAFTQVYSYAAVTKKLAEKYGLFFLPLQEKFDEAAAKFGPKPFLYDGVHPNVAGAALIAEEWLKLFNENIK